MKETKWQLANYAWLGSISTDTMSTTGGDSRSFGFSFLSFFSQSIIPVRNSDIPQKKHPYTWLFHRSCYDLVSRDSLRLLLIHLIHDDEYVGINFTRNRHVDSLYITCNIQLDRCLTHLRIIISTVIILQNRLPPLPLEIYVQELTAIYHQLPTVNSHHQPLGWNPHSNTSFLRWFFPHPTDRTHYHSRRQEATIAGKEYICRGGSNGTKTECSCPSDRKAAGNWSSG